VNVVVKAKVVDPAKDFYADPVVQVAIEGMEPVTSEVIKKAIRRKHEGENWELFEELGNSTGMNRERSIDVFALDTWPSGGFARVAYEVKISRSDFLRELREPAKRRSALLYATAFYFAVPKGLVRLDEVPVEAGLFEVEFDDERQPIGKITHASPLHSTYPPSWGFVSALVRSARRSGLKAA
jgi:hypothetical protein